MQCLMFFIKLPFGYLTVRHGKSPFLMGKPSISMGHRKTMANCKRHNQRLQKYGDPEFDIKFLCPQNPHGYPQHRSNSLRSVPCAARKPRWPLLQPPALSCWEPSRPQCIQKVNPEWRMKLVS